MMLIYNSIITSFISPKIIVQRFNRKIDLQTYLKKKYYYIKNEKFLLLNIAIFLPKTLDHK